MLVKVLGFNMRTWEEEWGFAFTDVDMEQFKVSSKTVAYYCSLNIFRFNLVELEG